MDRIAAMQLAAILPVAATALYERGTPLVWELTAAVSVTYFWQFLFARSRGSLIGWDGVLTAIIFVVLSGGTASIWQAILALTFGVVLGEQVFGGHGRAFLSPAAAGLAFLYFSFPASAPGGATPLTGAAVLPGAILLMTVGLVSWRIAIASYLALAAAGYLAGTQDALMLLTSGGFAFAVIFLGCDPVSSAATNTGRLIHGLVIGLATVLLSAGDLPIENAAVVFSVLIASIFAPVVDRGVIWVHANRARYRRA